MLKWTKLKESDSMKRSGKFRANGPASSGSNGKITMPSTVTTTSTITSPSSAHMNNNNHTLKDMPQNGSTPSHGDEASGSEPEGPVTLDVLLPSGEHTDIMVDYSTPMLDLLVCLAAKCRLNPTGLSLQLVDGETGKPVTYKPNQAIGVLGGREVRLVPREDAKGKSSRKQDKPFEITHRFIMNLPRGQKTVIRVSPLLPLGQLMTSVCEDKSLDLRRHVLQIPGQPGVKVDLSSTIQDLGLHELNLVAVGLQDPRSHMVSMPDLSKPPPSSTLPPSYMPMAGEMKKKRGFLSFLSKNKEKKYRTQNMETSSTTSHMARGPYPQASRGATTPPAQRRELNEAPHRPNHPDSRPKSMFVAAAAQPSNTDQTRHHTNPSQQKHQLQQQPVDITTGTAKKKRRAPAPPGPPAVSTTSTTSLPSPPSMVPPDSRSETHNGGHMVSALPAQTEQNEQQHQQEQQQQQHQQQTSRAELLSRLHSRNSSDSSGYHELTLSGAESPEAPGHQDHGTQQQSVGLRLKTSIDASSIESGLEGSTANGDSGVHDLSPTRVSPIEEVVEKIDQPAVSSDAAMSVIKSSTAALSTGAAPASGGKKRRKAPAPPPPVPSSTQPPLPSETPVAPSSSITTAVTAAGITTITTTTAEIETRVDVQPVDLASSQGSVEVVPEPSPQEASTPRQDDEDAIDKAIGNGHDEMPVASMVNNIPNGTSTSNTWSADGVDADDETDVSENMAFDINDILEGVTFDEEPKAMELQVARPRDMMMEETASITSESVDQVEVARNERPCAFIPPPPPDEPPPPEVQPVEDITALTRIPDPVLVDKGTEVNDDNTSLAPSSAKSSPGAVPASYKNEMALFVERMSKMAVETTSGGGSSGPLDDSVSSLSLPASDNNSDTGSVIQHVRGESQDSRESGSEAGGSLRGQTAGAVAMAEGALPMSEEISVPMETVPPPPEFGDDGREMGKNDEDEDEEEEYYTETVEEIIIPLTPRGYDFSAAQRVSAETISTEQSMPRKQEEKHEEVERESSGSTGVFRAEPVSIAPINGGSFSGPKPATPPVVGELPLPSASMATSNPYAPSAQPKKKEEFVLTTEDLDNVSFLPPPKPKSPRSVTVPMYKSEPFVSSNVVANTSLVMEKNNKSDLVSPRGHGALTFASTEPEDSPMENKPLSMLQYMPTMRIGGRGDAIPAPAFSDDSRSEDSNADASNDPLVNKLSPRLLVDSSQPVANKQKISYDELQNSDSPRASPSAEPTINSATASISSDISTNNQELSSAIQAPHDSEGIVDSSPRPSTEVDPQEALAAQYAALQAQFSQWQTQLSQNQDLLAAQTSPGLRRSSTGVAAGPELQVEQLQQLSDQVLVQQQMMQQLQQTMQALQQQQQQQQQQQNVQGAELRGKEHRDSSSTQALPPTQAVVTSPPPPPPPPPVPSLQTAPGDTPKQIFKGMPKVKTLDSPRPPKPTGRQSRFGPVLDPREELMLAIRGFKGREGLRSVSVNQTKWVHSNR